MFGLNSWSVLAPQALEGVAAVALLYAAVRRVRGPGAALLAGAVMALTPVAALIFRFNNPDALLVLALVAGAYCTQRACEQDSSRWWLVAAGATVGFGFLAKMLQAFLVLPGFHRGIPGRGGIARWAVGSSMRRRCSPRWSSPRGGTWCSSRSGRPTSRPYIGGSQHDSIVELALGYNGIGRLTGDEPGGLGNLNFDVGWGRLFGHSMGADIAWLLPAAVVCLGAGRGVSRGGAPRTDPPRAAADHLGRLAGGHRGGVQLHERHRAPVLHGGARTRRRRTGRESAQLCCGSNRSLTSAPPTAMAGTVLVTSVLAVCAADPRRRLAALATGRRSRSGEWRRRHCCWWRGGFDDKVARSVAASAVHGVAGRTVRVFRCHSGNSAYRRDTVGWARRSVASGRSGPGGLLSAPTPSAGLTATLVGRRRRLHVGRGGRGFEQRGGLPVGHRRSR